MRNVVVTGLGAITGIGLNVNDYWNNLVAGKSGMQKITRIPVEEHDTTVGVQVDDAFEELTSKYWKKRQLNVTTKMVRMGLASAGEAMDDCGVTPQDYDGRRIAVIYGILNNSYEEQERENRLNLILKQMPTTVSSLVAIKYGIKGPGFNCSTACASSAYAIALGKMFIQAGLCDMAVVGGVGTQTTHDMLTGFNQVFAMSINPDPETACRPFTKNRDGFIMGEGAGTIILEAEETAVKRNAKIYCRLLGASMTSEAFNMTAPETDGIGMEEAIRIALQDAGISPEKIDYINAHGTSTGLNDKYETMAIKKVLGEHAYDTPVSSIKAAIGHTLAAGGVLEAIATVKAMETGVLPPTVHYDEPDPECDLDYIPNEARKKEISIAISNSFGFGGNNSTLVFGKY